MSSGGSFDFCPVKSSSAPLAKPATSKTATNRLSGLLQLSCFWFAKQHLFLLITSTWTQVGLWVGRRVNADLPDTPLPSRGGYPADGCGSRRASFTTTSRLPFHSAQWDGIDGPIDWEGTNVCSGRQRMAERLTIHTAQTPHAHACTGEENKPIDMTFRDQWSIQN